MAKSSRQIFLEGMFASLLIIAIIILTILYSEQLIKYSGITTFYSLVLFIVFFIIKEMRTKNEETQQYIAELHGVSYQTDQIKSNLKYFKDAIHAGQIPAYSIGSYDFELPIAVDKVPTRKLADLLALANEKIETLNEIRDGLSNILIGNIEAKPKKLAQLLGTFLGNIGFSVDETVEEIETNLDAIRKELKKWNI